MPWAELAVFTVVNGPYRHLDNPETACGKKTDEVVRVAEARPDRVEIQELERAPGNGRVAALGVVDGLADRKRGHEREESPADLSPQRHAGRAFREAISLRVVGDATNQWHRDGLEIVWMHLSVAGHDARDVAARIARPAIARRDRGSDTAIRFVSQHGRARLLGDRARGIFAGIVDDADRVDPFRHRRDHAADAELLSKGGYDDDDALSFEHRAQVCAIQSPVRKRIFLALGLAIAIAILAFAIYRPYPSDHTPEGAYMRIARAVTEDRMEDTFAYLEEDARWASYTIRDDRKKAYDRIAAAYPEPERSKMLAEYKVDAEAADGSNIFSRMAHERGFVTRLRKDLSGVASTEINGERATVVTTRGTRYSFRKRENGIWGLTMFTAEMVVEKDKAARDLAVVEAAADDYARAKKP